MKERVRRSIIHRADTWLLSSNVTRLVAQSKTVQQRLRRFNGLESEVVYPPAPQRAYRCDRFEPFVFAVSRFAPLKRLDLLVEALAGRKPEAFGPSSRARASSGLRYVNSSRIVDSLIV